MSLLLRSQYVNMEGCRQVMRRGESCPSFDPPSHTSVGSQGSTVSLCAWRMLSSRTTHGLPWHLVQAAVSEPKQGVLVRFLLL